MRIFADLVSNYDLLDHIVDSLSHQIVNVPKETIICTFTNLQNITHLVRTAFEDYKSTYGGDTWFLPLNHPPQGLGKGNGADPYIWDIVSKNILNCPRESGHGEVLKCCI